MLRLLQQSGVAPEARCALSVAQGVAAYNAPASGCRADPYGAKYRIAGDSCSPRGKGTDDAVPETNRAPDDTLPGLIIVAAVALALLSLGLFLLTLHPGVGPSLDSMELQIAARVGGIIHPPGSPQYLMLGRLAMDLLPGPNAAYRLNLMSSIFAAAMTGALFLLAYRLSQNLVASSYVALTVALSPRLWYQASIAELYALNAFYVALVLFLLISWHQTGRRGFFWAAMVAYALSFGNHLSMILLLPAVLYVVEITDRSMLLRPRNLLLVLLIVALGALQYLYVPLRVAANPPFCNYCPSEAGSLLDYLTGGPFKGQMFSLPRRDVLARLPEATGLFARQFFPWGLALGVVGLWELFQRRAELAWTLVLALAPQLLFVMTYAIPDWHDFMTPAYVIFAPLVGYGAWRLWEALRPQADDLLLRGRVLAGHTYPVVLVTLAAFAVALSLYTHRPLVDQSQQTAYEVNARALLGRAQPGDWVFIPPPNSADFYYSWAVTYLSLAESDLPRVSMVAPPEIDVPPGPPPTYLRWADAEPQLTGAALHELDRTVFALDSNDPRLQGWGLLPVCTPGGGAVAGYEVVAAPTSAELAPLVSAERWARIEDYVMASGGEVRCPPAE